MSNKYLNVIPYVKCDIDFGVPVLAILGLIYSKWAFDYFLSTVYDSRYYVRRNEFMINEIKITHYILAVTTVYLLYLGFKDANKRYIRLWYNFKIFECVCLLIGAGVFLRFNWPFALLSGLILGYGWYIIKNVQLGFNELPNEDTVIQNLDNLDAANEKPPPYTESIINEIPMEISNVLRNSCFIKVFEFIFVLPNLFLVIVHEYGTYYDIKNSVLLIAGLSFIFIIIINYVWNIIPAYVNKSKQEQENIIPIPIKELHG